MHVNDLARWLQQGVKPCIFYFVGVLATNVFRVNFGFLFMGGVAIVKTASPRPYRFPVKFL
ncbi:hypothetical protein ACVGWQ_02865, partial [Enterobacter hormaechei]